MARRAVTTVVCVLLSSLLLAASASASTTFHGTFTSGVGYKTSAPDAPIALSGYGVWNVDIGRQSAQVTGQVSVLRQPCDNQPCPFNIPLSLVQWTEPQGSQVSGALDLGAVHFDVTLAWSNGSATMTMVITGCPYNWGRWVFTGTATRG